MILSLLSLFTLMIRRLICSPNLLIANGLNSFVKTLVLSPWIDLLFSSSVLMHLHLVLCFALFNMFLFVFFFSFTICFSKKLKKNYWKIRKIQKQCMFVYIGTCISWMAIETKFSKLWASLCLSKWVFWLVCVMSKIK